MSIMEWGGYISILIKEMPSYISHKSFIAEDGEGVTIVEFESEEKQHAWSIHPEHLSAKKKGRKYFNQNTEFKCVKYRGKMYSQRSELLRNHYSIKN